MGLRPSPPRYGRDLLGPIPSASMSQRPGAPGSREDGERWAEAVRYDMSDRELSPAICTPSVAAELRPVGTRPRHSRRRGARLRLMRPIGPGPIVHKAGDPPSSVRPDWSKNNRRAGPTSAWSGLMSIHLRPFCRVCARRPINSGVAREVGVALLDLRGEAELGISRKVSLGASPGRPRTSARRPGLIAICIQAGRPRAEAAPNGDASPIVFAGAGLPLSRPAPKKTAKVLASIEISPAMVARRVRDQDSRMSTW